MKCMLTWVLGGQVAGYSLPDQLLYDDEAQCQKAADKLNKMGVGGMSSTPTTVTAACILVPEKGEGRPDR